MLRRALARLPRGVGRVALGADAGYFAVDLAVAAHQEGVTFTIGATRIASLWRALAGISASDWAEAIGIPGAQVAIADYRPASTRLLIRRVSLDVYQICAASRARRRRTLHPDQRAPPPEKLSEADAVYGYSFILTNHNVTTPARAVAVEHCYRHRRAAGPLELAAADGWRGAVPDCQHAGRAARGVEMAQRPAAGRPPAQGCRDPGRGSSGRSSGGGGHQAQRDAASCRRPRPPHWSSSRPRAPTATRCCDPLLRALLRALDAELRQWCEHEGDPVASGLREAYQHRCATLGEQVRVELPAQPALIGAAEQIDTEGRLVVVSDGQRRALSVGDVTYVRIAHP